MKSLVILCMLLATLHASDIDIAAKILDRTVQGLYEKMPVKVWAETAKQKNMVLKSNNMQLVNEADMAAFILIESKKPENIAENAIIFSTNYDMLEDSDVIGAFFWQKGRPNLIFIKKRLYKYGVKLSKEFDKYIEDDI